MGSALLGWITANLKAVSPIFAALIALVGGAIAYVLTWFIEKKGTRGDLELEGLQIDNARKLAEFSQILANTGQTPESLSAIRERVTAMYGGTGGRKPEISGSLWCSVYVPPRIARAEGLSESMGDIVLIFTGPQSGQVARHSLNIELVLNVNIAAPIGRDHLTDVQLWLDDGPSENRLLGRGRLEGPKSLIFENISIEAPAQRQARTLKIKNLRAEVANLGVPGPEMRVLAFFAIRRSDRIPVPVANDLANLALPQLATAIKFIPENREMPLAAAPPGQTMSSFYVRFKPLQPDAFKARSQEAGSGGAATNGTRFLMRFYDLPGAIRVFVPARDIAQPATGGSGNARAILMNDTDGNGAGGSATRLAAAKSEIRARDGTPLVELRAAGGFAFAVWEWIAGGDANQDDVFLGAALSAEGHLNLEALKVSVCLAPISTVPGFSEGPVPRFIDGAAKVSIYQLMAMR